MEICCLHHRIWIMIGLNWLMTGNACVWFSKNSKNECVKIISYVLKKVSEVVKRHLKDVSSNPLWLIFRPIFGFSAGARESIHMIHSYASLGKNFFLDGLLPWLVYFLFLFFHMYQPKKITVKKLNKEPIYPYLHSRQ